VTGLQFLLDLQDKHDALLPGVLTLNRAKMREVFMQSRAAMYADNGDLNRTIEKAVGSGQIKAETMDLWPMRAPHLPGKEPLMFSDQAGWCVFKQTDDAKRAAAMDFCHFLTDKDNIKAVTANNIFPARKSAGDLYPGDPYQAFLQTLVPLSSSFDTGHPYYFDYRHLETFMFQGVLAHQKTPQAALDELADETNKVLRDAG
jgi:multiple sugar transport system substrate-binding protein